ncbi:carboxypeptidase M32 [Priestia megaterium]|uniref:carboxypeptidase M32 n=2 Tax=Priestia megaterium TaxID=1404 RepID=UPI000BF6DF33|nr:carboxypeptidase M32 [Priestia megaterium]MBZ5479027.1 carboxypeptidase M32 [Bacillus sp. T_4]PFP17276.1 carboxypeptidase M32 [Priestia megaterium]PFU66417.1 carboxypeptidase M32 [Priestia megaterium]PGX44922.1 carboxypeptidase M32 [Priestia megaterium]UYO26702.1 carboxypeptidase M32 [Bacillus sp. T_4]
MREDIQKIEKQFYEYMNKIKSYHEAIGVMYWDLRTGAPKKGADQRSEVIGMMSSEAFNLSVSDDMAGFIEKLTTPESQPYINDITKKAVEECKKEYDLNKKIPPHEYKEYVTLTSKAESVWEDAKEKADFALFQPYLEKIVAFNQKFVEYWGYEGNKYNRLLDLFEPGMTVEILDEVFGKLREHIVPLVQRIAGSNTKPNTEFLFRTFPKEAQKQFSLDVLKTLGYDFEAGRLDETVHPFATGLNPGDVRITTKYAENDFRTAIFGTIHECGHALYEQNISKDLVGTVLCEGTSMGIHESQSLFFEQFVGKNKAFWQHHYDVLKKHAPGQFDDVDLEDFYRGVNEAKPSLIRIEADELTYPLHIMIRYEIEKGLINGEYKVADLPEIWNEKYEEYLGVRPSHDGEGVLQDVHWAGGSFGYFPSYALGYMYAAQFKHTMLKDLPNYDELLEKGEISSITNWLTEHIHQYGKMKKPLEILNDVTGEGLNVDYLIQYLEKKYGEIYHV